MLLKREGLYPSRCVWYFKTRQERSELTEAHLLCQHSGNSYRRPKLEWWDLGTNLEIRQLTVSSPQCPFQAPPPPHPCAGDKSILSSLHPLSVDRSAAGRAPGWGDGSWQGCEILIQAQILIGLVHRSDFLSWWGMQIHCSSLVSATLAAGCCWAQSFLLLALAHALATLFINYSISNGNFKMFNQPLHCFNICICIISFCGRSWRLLTPHQDSVTNGVKS